MIETLHIEFERGLHADFEVNEGVDAPACFVLSVRKCGSTLLNNICKSVAAFNGRNYVDVGVILFKANILADKWQRSPELPSILRPGNVYGGFRDAPLALVGNDLFERSRKVLLIRDPRDALVSEYFSMSYSHVIPAPKDGARAATDLMETLRRESLQTPLDDAVVQRARAFAKTMTEYAPMAGDANLKVLKYEDYIFRKADLIRAITRHFGWQLNDRIVEGVLSWADVRPSVEDPHAFIRRVSPGDHREKLKPATIASLNEILRPAMEMFGYEP